jgi:20S proteasome alpha/beta subunit
MTIAAGFKINDGILLCADTRLTGGIKLERSKLESFPIGDDVNVALAFAGDDFLMWNAIDDCRDKLLAKDADVSSLPKIKQLVRDALRPLSQEYPQERMQLLVAVRLGQDLNLLATSEARLKEVRVYECIGSGEALAHYILDTSFNRKVSLPQARMLAAHALLAAKDVDEPCGGHSEMLLLRSDGSVETMAQRQVENLEDCIYQYRRHAYGIILRGIVDPDMDDVAFRNSCSVFFQLILRIRAAYRSNLKGLEDFDRTVQAMNEEVARLEETGSGEPEPDNSTL